ncbi:MAG: hypothetical protein M1817_003035 [Caeruleum heppii]|nr:MAG: hypothetical protein M1817_003035 [Caeruleum heppii]
MASCASCYLRDLHSMCMANKTWRRAARPRMYCAIWIVGNDSIAQTRKKFKTRYGARLRLLRRTLRENPILAGFVRELKGPAIPDARSFGGAERQHYLDTVASVVMACPNLERLTGFYVSYDHTFDRLSHALSTRTRLKEHVWVVAGNDSMRQLPSNYLDPGFLQPEEMDMFLHLHDQWGRLETLFLHSHSDGVLEHELFVGVFSRLPSLRHLCVSGFHVHDFGDVTLQALPPLQSLRLQNLRGVTDRGVLRYASTPAAQDLERLSLINLELTSLPVLSKVFACLRYLKRFTLIQRRPPELEPSGLILQPIIGSSSLEWLHWDVADPGEANNLLSASIEANGFPNLRAIRAPSDDEGSLQSVCRPLEQATITTDKYNFPQRYANSGHRASVYAKTLFAARKSAQERIELARARFKFHIVIEEEGVVKQVFKIPDFIGSLESQITYSLKPDIHGSDRAVIDLPDLLDGSKELEARDGCTGVWNSDHPSGKKWWSHTERFRYRKVDLERFF